MKLLTKELENKFKKIWIQDWKWEKAIVIAKFFMPYKNWTWYATEYEPETKMFFWLVDWLEVELWYFSLEEFEMLNKSWDFMKKVERDLYWTKKTIWEVKNNL